MALATPKKTAANIANTSTLPGALTQLWNAPRSWQLRSNQVFDLLQNDMAVIASELS